ncbi:MAG: hypothetical protein HY080_00425 [Gammaproteobacteria bacterium]|nr:hypothetical protein [Gammaproteobacteria bacterium]
MKLSDFSIGCEFVCADKRWRCTDVGTRVVVAICLEPGQISRYRPGYQQDPAVAVERLQSNDPSWFKGPPYAISEIVFDEYDHPACIRVK